jgi:hypothetical protein
MAPWREAIALNRAVAKLVERVVTDPDIAARLTQPAGFIPARPAPAGREERSTSAGRTDVLHPWPSVPLATP